MKRLADLQALLAKKDERLDQLQALRTTESRDFSEDEKAEWQRLTAEIKTIAEDIRIEQEIEARDKQKARDKAAAAKTPEQKVREAFSFSRGLNLLWKKETLDGVEREMQQEAQREADAIGRFGEVRGLALPSFLFNVKGQNVYSDHARDLTVGGVGTGSELVNDDYKGHIYGLSINPKIAELGATFLLGLTGDPKWTKSGTVTTVWEGENDAQAEGTPSTETITMSPKRMGLYADISKMLNAQTNGLANTIAKFEIERAMGVGIDAAAINGSGSAPTGLLGMSGGINTKAIGANGGPLTRAHLLGMKTLIAEDNALTSVPKFLTTYGVEEFLKNLNVDAGSGRFVWNEDTDKVVGYMAAASNNVPDDLTKGSSSSICHAIILGCWENLWVGQWGPLDIVIDPFSRSKEFLSTVVINGLFDVKARYEQSFCVTKDVLVS